jgi:hypothetical protein
MEGLEGGIVSHILIYLMQIISYVHTNMCKINGSAGEHLTFIALRREKPWPTGR